MGRILGLTLDQETRHLLLCPANCIYLTKIGCNVKDVQRKCDAN